MKSTKPTLSNMTGAELFCHFGSALHPPRRFLQMKGLKNEGHTNRNTHIDIAGAQDLDCNVS